MATKMAVTTALTLLARVFAGEVDREKVEVYAAAWEDLSDEELMMATADVIKTHTGSFIPPPAVIRAACGIDRKPAPDVDAILRALDGLGEYNPNGWILPRQSLVKELLGGVIAAAYSEVGGSRLFGDDPTTRDIAKQEFAKALRAEIAASPRVALPAWATVERLDAVIPKALPERSAA